MRMIRTVLAAPLAAVLTLGLGASLQAPAGAADRPKRVIVSDNPKDDQVGLLAFRLKGAVSEPLPDLTLTPYADGVVKLQKKSCGKCRWKVVKKLRTNDRGVFRTRIYTPMEGSWKWRVKVPASDGYAGTKGKAYTLYLDES